MWMGSEDEKPVGCRQLHLKDKTTRKKPRKRSAGETRHPGDRLDLLLRFDYQKMLVKSKTRRRHFPLAPINLRSTAIVFKCNFPKMERGNIRV